MTDQERIAELEAQIEGWKRVATMLFVPVCTLHVVEAFPDNPSLKQAIDAAMVIATKAVRKDDPQLPPKLSYDELVFWALGEPRVKVPAKQK